MVGFFVRAGKALKEGTKVITGVKPLKKISGSKTVEQMKTRASAARASAASFNYKAGIGKAMRKMKDIKWEPTLK